MNHSSTSDGNDDGGLHGGHGGDQGDARSQGHERSSSTAILQGRIDGRVAFEQALRALVTEASKARWPVLWFVDTDFAGWPLGEREVVEQLDRWIGARTSLVLLAASYDAMARNHARLSRWRQAWGHRIDCRVAHEDDAARVPTAALVPGVLGMVLHDVVRWRGEWVQAGAALQSRIEEVQGLLARSSPGWPLTTLGL